jgi:hypothetical protein
MRDEIQGRFSRLALVKVAARTGPRSRLEAR